MPVGVQWAVDLDPTWLFLSLIPSGVGFVLFVYGKKQQRWPHLVAGLAMMAYPYFTSWIKQQVVDKLHAVGNRSLAISPLQAQSPAGIVLPARPIFRAYAAVATYNLRLTKPLMKGPLTAHDMSASPAK